MRINKIKIDQEITSLSGLNKIELNRLETVVALVGKNGSGKSRVLNCIENSIDSIINLKNILNGEISGFPKKIQAALKKIEPYKELVLINIEIDENNNRRKLNPNNKELNNLHKELNDKRKELLKISDTKSNIYDVNTRVIRTAFPIQNIEQNSELQKTISLLTEINPLIEPLKKNYIKRINYSEISQLQCTFR